MQVSRPALTAARTPLNPQATGTLAGTALQLPAQAALLSGRAVSDLETDGRGHPALQCLTPRAGSIGSGGASHCLREPSPCLAIQHEVSPGRLPESRDVNALSNVDWFDCMFNLLTSPLHCTLSGEPLVHPPTCIMLQRAQPGRVAAYPSSPLPERASWICGSGAKDHSLGTELRSAVPRP